MARKLERVDELLAAAAAAGDVPGAIATVVDRDGVVYEGAAGRLAIDGEAQADTETVVWFASMTKPLATVGLLQLVEQGRLELDQRVDALLPEFGELRVLDGFDGDEPRLRAASGPATVRQLLTHTAGCGYSFLDADLHRWYGTTGCMDPLSCEPAFLDAPLVADPGTRWEYGISVDWAGVLLERVTKSKLDAYLSEHVFEPLGMAETTFRARDAQRPRMMVMHQRIEDGELVRRDLDLPTEPRMACAGHGAYGTVGDYGRFLRALLRGGELDGARILREETVKLALSPQIGSLPLPEITRSADPESSNDIVALPVRRSWGLGFELVLEDLPDMRRAGTGGWAGLSNCYFWLDPESGVAAVFLTQVLPFFDERILGRVQELELATYAHRRKVRV